MMKRRLVVVLMVVAMLVALLPCIFASASDDAQTAKGYMVGNSLTMSMSPARFAALLATQDYKVTLGGQLLGDTSLPEHIGMRLVGDEEVYVPWRRWDPVTGAARPKANITEGAMSNTTHGLNGTISGHYFTAMQQNYFDFVSLQTYGSWPNTPDKWNEYAYDHTMNVTAEAFKGDYYEYMYLGDRQAIGLMVDYATRQLRDSDGTVGADTFLIYESWTYQDRMGVDTDKNGIRTFSEFYNADYFGPDSDISLVEIKANYNVPNKHATEELMSGLRSDFAHLGEDAIRLVPVSAIFAKLDEMIIAGELPGVENYFNHNKDYYEIGRSSFDKKLPQALRDNLFVQEYGFSNFFVDGVHMASFQVNYSGGTYYGYHSGERDGTLPSYITAIAMYSVLTGYSPVGLPVDMGVYGRTNYKNQYVKADKDHDARLDAVEDAELIRAVQEVVFEVLCENQYTGITEDAPQRTASTVGHIAGNGGIARVTSAQLAKAPARIATEVAVAVAENPVWTPDNAPVAAPVEQVVIETKKREE